MVAESVAIVSCCSLILSPSYAASMPPSPRISALLCANCHCLINCAASQVSIQQRRIPDWWVRGAMASNGLSQMHSMLPISHLRLWLFFKMLIKAFLAPSLVRGHVKKITVLFGIFFPTWGGGGLTFVKLDPSVL